MSIDDQAHDKILIMLTQVTVPGCPDASPNLAPVPYREAQFCTFSIRGDKAGGALIPRFFFSDAKSVTPETHWVTRVAILSSMRTDPQFWRSGMANRAACKNPSGRHITPFFR